VLWHGLVWCGVVWCGVLWCGVMWCGVVWCVVVWCCAAVLLCAVCDVFVQVCLCPRVRVRAFASKSLIPHYGCTWTESWLVKKKKRTTALEQALMDRNPENAILCVLKRILRPGGAAHH
jgi:hypothetical protein